jgi:hypothetical protein
MVPRFGDTLLLLEFELVDKIEGLHIFTLLFTLLSAALLLPLAELFSEFFFLLF